MADHYFNRKIKYIDLLLTCNGNGLDDGRD